MNILKRIVDISLIIIGILLGIHLLGYIFRPTSTDDAYYQIETLHSLPPESVEVIAYGSSHTLRGLNTPVMHDNYGINAYNYGWNWQNINTIRLFLIDSLLEQKPKIALIETYTVGMISEDTDITAQVYYCNYIHDKQAKKEYMQQCLGKKPSLDRRLSYIMPLAMFHDNWSSLSDESFTPLKPGGSELMRREMGFLRSDDVTKVSVNEYNPQVQLPLSPKSIRELDKIVEICNNNNIKIVFFVIPGDETYEYNDAMARYATKNNCEFIDFTKNDIIKFDGDMDFSDRGHLNTRGATKVAEYLGKYITENYNLTD